MTSKKKKKIKQIDVFNIPGIIACPAPMTYAQETLQLLLKGDREQLTKNRKDAWEKALENARRQTSYFWYDE